MADLDVNTPAVVSSTGRRTTVVQRFTEIDTGVYAQVMTIGGLATPVTLTGDVVLDTFGALNNAKVIDPDAASATVPALLRGALAQQVALVAVLGAVNNGTEPDPDAATATIASLLRAVLEQQIALIAVVGAAGDSAGANTVIGQLKQIVTNTGV